MLCGSSPGILWAKLAGRVSEDRHAHLMAHQKRLRKWCALMQFHTPDTDFRVLFPRFCCTRVRFLGDLENHALLCRFRGWAANCSCKTEADRSQQKNTFSGTPKYRPAMLFHSRKTTIFETRQRTKSTQNIHLFECSKITRCYAASHSEP